MIQNSCGDFDTPDLQDDIVFQQDMMAPLETSTFVVPRVRNQIDEIYAVELPVIKPKYRILQKYRKISTVKVQI